jgi:hypothetical protein
MKYVVFWAQQKRQIEIVSSMNSDDQCIENSILSFCVILLVLLSLKYNVFCFKNLQNDRVQHYLCHGIFSKYFEMFVFKSFEL